MTDHKSMIVIKDEEKRLITAPVLIPYCADCDAKRGEKQLSPTEIQSISHEYMANYRIVDKMHDFFQTGQDVADVVESWQLRQPTTFKNVFDEEKTYPAGTWMATTRVNDDTTWDKVKKGEYNGYSVTALSKNVAQQLASAKSIDAIQISNKERVLIKDLEDPVGYTISIVDRPCVYDAKFVSVKSDSAEKAGRRFSDATFGKLRKFYDNAKDSLDGIKTLIDAAETERSKVEVQSGGINKSEEIEVDKDELKGIFKEELKPVNDAVEAIKSDVENLKKGAKQDPPEDEKGKDKGGSSKADTQTCAKCKAENPADAKFCSACGAKLGESDKSDETEDETDDPVNKRLDAIENKLGIKSEGNHIKGQDGEGGNPTPATKSLYEESGRDALGIPIRK